MEKLPLSFGPENFDDTPQKPWDKQPKTDHLGIRIDFGGKCETKARPKNNLFIKKSACYIKTTPSKITFSLLYI